MAMLMAMAMVMEVAVQLPDKGGCLRKKPLMLQAVVHIHRPHLLGPAIAYSVMRLMWIFCCRSLLGQLQSCMPWAPRQSNYFSQAVRQRTCGPIKPVKVSVPVQQQGWLWRMFNRASYA